LYFLDFKYLSFLKDLKITVTKEESQITITTQDIKNLEIPTYFYVLKGKGSGEKPPESMAFPDVVANFLKKLTDLESDTLEKRRDRFQLI
jgi:hypothetical protein